MEIALTNPKCKGGNPYLSYAPKSKECWCCTDKTNALTSTSKSHPKRKDFNIYKRVSKVEMKEKDDIKDVNDPDGYNPQKN